MNDGDSQLLAKVKARARRSLGRTARITWGHGARARIPYRLTPTSTYFGFDRGTPVDRYYIDQYLSRFGGSEGYATGAIRGRVLEIGGREYVDRFGLTGDPDDPAVVRQVDVLHANAANREATIVGDLENMECLPEGAFDCIICTQTLQVIYDFRAALRSMHRGLADGGVLLVTVPGITSACTPDRDDWGDWWRFTASSIRRLLGEVFAPEDVYAESYGNVLSAVAFLHGLAAEELRAGELDSRDPGYEVLVTARAIKRLAAPSTT